MLQDTLILQMAADASYHSNQAFINYLALPCHADQTVQQSSGDISLWTTLFGAGNKKPGRKKERSGYSRLIETIQKCSHKL